MDSNVDIEELTSRLEINTMNTASIAYNVNGEDTLAKSLRRVRRFFPLAFQKLVLLSWYWATEGIGSYGATDGRRLFLNPDGLKKIERTSDPVGYLAFLLVHEALHALLNHALRLAKLQNHQLANVAADYVINAIIDRINKQVLAEEGFVPFPFISGILHDDSIAYNSKNESLSAEEVYQNLAKGQQPEQDQDQPEPQAGDDQEDGEQTGGGQGGSSEEDGEQEDGEQGDSGNPDPDAPLTDEEILGGDFVGTGSDDLTEPELADGETEQEVDQQIEIENEQIEIEAKANEAQGIGSGGKGTIDVSNARSNRDGVIDFSEALTDLLRQNFEGGWTKPFNSQMFEGGGVVCHGRGSNNAGEIAFLVDLSGSNYHEAADMISRTEDAFDSISPEIIHLVGFDDEVTEHHEVFNGDALPKHLKGGGGTDIALALRWVEENIPHVEAIIVLTDGYDHWNKIERSEPSAPVVWLNYGDERWHEPNAYSFGDKLDVDIL